FLGGLSGAGRSGFALSGGTINPFLGTPFENILLAPASTAGIPGAWQLQLSASGESPQEFAQSFRLDAALETGAGADGISFEVPGVGNVEFGADGSRVDASITPGQAELTASARMLLGSAELHGNLDLTDGSFYLSANQSGPTLTIVDTDVFSAVNSSAIVELGVNGQRPDGSRFTGFAASLDLSLADIAFADDIPVIGSVGFGIGGNLSGRLEAGTINNQFAYSGTLTGEAHIHVDLPGSDADFDVAHAIDLAIQDAVDEFTIPLPTISVAGVQVILPDIRVRLSQNSPQSEIGELQIRGLDIGAIAGTLRDLYDFTAGQVASALARAEYAMDEIGRALEQAFGLSANAAAAVLADANFAATQVSDAMAGAYGASREAVASILHSIGYGFTQIGGALSHTFAATAAETAQIISNVGAGVRDAAAMLRDAFGQSAATAAATLRSIGVGADQVSQALRDTYNLTASETVAILRDIGYSVGDIGNVISHQYFDTAGRAVRLLQDLGYGTTEVLGAVQSAFSLTEGEIAEVLTNVGLPLSEVVAGLTGAGETLATAANVAIGALGATPEQVTQAFVSLGATATEWSSALFSAGVNGVEVARLLQNVGGQTLSQVGGTLRSVGRSIRDVANILSSRLGGNLTSLPDLLLDAGFTPSLITSTLGGSQVTALVNAFQRRVSSNLNTVGNILSSAGFTGGTIAVGFFQNGIAAGPIVTVLRTLNFNSRQTLSTLRSIGYAVPDITRSMRYLYSSSQTLDGIVNGLGVTYTFDIIPWMVNANYGQADVYYQMRRIGFNATSLAQVIDQVCRSSDRTVTEFLATAGYSESAIRGALNSVFGSVGSFFNDVFDSFSIF
ncbi:MAG: hypothetical protein KDA92_20015, partial [Planctomycetales bacterium]|nr:hypothetical protein [Planctomycetales bacterium]